MNMEMSVGEFVIAILLTLILFFPGAGRSNEPVKAESVQVLKLCMR